MIHCSVAQIHAAEVDEEKFIVNGVEIGQVFLAFNEMYLPVAFVCIRAMLAGYFGRFGARGRRKTDENRL